MALHTYPLGWSRYQDANPVPTSPLADDITTAPSGLVNDDCKVVNSYLTLENNLLKSLQILITPYQQQQILLLFYFYYSFRTQK